MSPEQLRAQRRITGRIFFPLARLYEMLTWKRAFHRTSILNDVGDLKEERGGDYFRAVAIFLPAFERVVNHCLRKIRARFLSARDLSVALEAISGISGRRERSKP